MNRNGLRAVISFASCLLVPLLATPSLAQLHRATDPVMTPASSLVLQDDALAIDVNPAALGLLPASSFAYLHSEVDREASYLGRGDALFLAGHVIGPLSMGLTLQSIRPGEHAALPPFSSGGDRAMAALGIALAPAKGVSFGFTTRAFSSGDARFDGLTAIDLGMLVRPSSYLALSLVGRDLFVSREGFGTAGLELGSSGVVGVGIRPTGTDFLTLDMALAVDLDDRKRLAGRGGLTLELPRVGAASALIELENLDSSDPAMRAMAELAISLGSTSFVAGGTAGDGFDDQPGWYGMIKSDGRLRSRAIAPRSVLDLELSDMSPRGMIAVAVALERARSSARVAGVILRPRSTSIGIAYAQELRLQIRALQNAGKPVVCHLESASGAEYYACSAADRVVMDPAGDIRLMGLATSVLLFGDTLRKIGVRADFVRIGPYKSAPEQLTQNHMSEEAREQANRLLDDGHQRMLFDLAGDLKITPEAVAALMDRGPHLGAEALQRKLVDAVIDERELDEDDNALRGQRLVDDIESDDAGKWGKQPSVGVIVIDDTIVDGESVDIPIVDIHMTGGRTIVEELEQMAADPSIRAIVLRVDSPGGAVVASDQIWRAVRRARERKPVIASLGSVAASGGYYVASAADEIWADPSTITGSIGIFYGKVDVEQLAGEIGVGIEHLRRGQRAGAESMYRPFTDEERAALADVMRSYYRMFLERVAEGRSMSVAQVDAVARGRVHSGDAAQKLGLVDRLGGLASAIARARQRAELAERAPVVVRPRRPSGIVDYVLGGSSASAWLADDEPAPTAGRTAIPMTPELRALARTLITMSQLGSGTPLALMPFAVELQ
jgi:protease-4